MKISPNDNLQTPEYIFKSLGLIDLDPCAGAETQIGILNLWDGRGEDGLSAEWTGFVYCNPPFSQKELWIKKMIEHNNGILLLPERGSAPWFGPLAEASGRYFVMGKKIDFIGGSSSNNVGSVLFPFGEEAVKRVIESGLPGHFVTVEFFNQRKAV
ncbi:DNA N-6-adenine-methyltransferase [uncultured Chryseobacterium sp.]|uniref:DNA N-6-adenine-methyltransferase n=1 Tax=uncultured Chryseobacterium sp. TaxID=259322 RepID=UPI0025F9E9A9|nr:DNA N-6-adenine-methyltransferase [uncultured Chryseobacterium sp.]